MPNLFPILPSIMNYSWGKVGKQSLACRFFENLAEDQNYAELWYGAHAKAPSAVMNSENNLLDIINKNEDSLPFLAKFLSIKTALSIQCHPDKTQAEILRGKDPANYPDSNHKPEVAIALSEVSMLHGWIDDIELARIKTSFPEIENLQISNWDAEGKKSLLCRLFKGDQAESLNRDIATRLKAKNSLSKRENVFLKLFDLYGAGDSGVSLSLFLRLLELKPFQSIYTPSCHLHAYLEGDLFECMANSDNVIRAGLTNKFIDRQAILDYADFESCSIKIEDPEQFGNFLSFADNSDEFKVLYQPDMDGELDLQLQKNSVELIVLFSGRLNIENISIQQGQAVFIPASATHIRLKAENASFFRVFVPEQHI